MSDALRRGVRTFVQVFVTAFLATNALSAVGADGKIDATDITVLYKAVVAAALAGLTALAVWAQNALEDRGAIPSVLKSTASSGANPVTEDPSGVSP